MPSEIVVSFKENVDVGKIRSYKGYKIKDTIKELNLALVEVDQGKELSSIKSFQSKDDVYFAEYNTIGYIDWVPNDPRFSDQWGPKEIGCRYAWNSGQGDYDVVIAIVDSGVDFDHEDSSTHRIRGYDFINKDNNPDDDNGHGTHCAGIAAAHMNNDIGVAGVAKATIMAVKVINSYGGGTAFGVSQGITYAANHGAWIISLSLGFYLSHTSLRAACSYAYNIKRALIVAASGNDGWFGCNYPANYNTVIAVGATTSSNNRADFSNYGFALELMAPGVDILSTFPGNQYYYLSGTSMATPHVAGVAALYYSKYCNYKSPVKCRYKLRSTADDLGPRGKDIYYGYGLVDAALLT